MVMAVMVAGCDAYAFGVGFFGLNNIVTLAAIAVERYIVITAKPAAAKWRITRRQARKVNPSIFLLLLLNCCCCCHRVAAATSEDEDENISLKFLLPLGCLPLLLQ